MARNGFCDVLTGWLDKHGLLKADQRWVLGVSGGADSTVLAHALSEISAQQSLQWRLQLAHLHHGLRGAEADEDEQFVRGLADKLNAGFFSERVDVAAKVSENGGSTEEVAREERYAFLERAALMAGSDLVAVAHHADDDAETILHRICRGTGLRGLAGMTPIRPIRAGSRVRLARPLLHQTRTAIESLIEERGWAYRTDSTNVSPAFTRGRVRHTVLPLLREQLNPNVTDALLRLGEQARWLGTYLQDAAARVFESLIVFEGPQRVVLNAKALLTKQRIIQAEVIRLTSSLVIGGEQDLGFTHIEAVLKLAEAPGSGKEAHLPGRVVVRKQYDRLDFRHQSVDAPAPEIPPVFVKCPGLTRLPQLNLELAIEETTVDAGKIDELRRDNSPYEEWLDLERVLPPLYVRGRKDGDRFHPLGAPGAKTLGDFLIGEKIDPLQRARTGVLCDQAGVIWVMPLRIDERVKLRPTSTRALHIMLHPKQSRSTERL